MACSCLIVIGTLVRGGGERQAILTAQGLQAAGIDTRIVVLQDPVSLGAEATASGVTWVSPGRPGLGAHLARLLDLVERHRPDTVVTFLESAALRWLLARAMSPRARRVAWVHSQRGHLTIQDLLRWPIRSLLYRRVLSSAHRLVVNSAPLAANVISLCDEAGARIEIVPNTILPDARAEVGLEDERLVQGWRQGSGPLLGILGSFQRARNHVLAARTLSLLLPAHPGARLVAIGRAHGPHARFRDDFLRVLAACGAEDRVTIAGELDGARRLLSSFDAVLCCSQLEGSSNALAEAMVSGAATATTPVADAAELVGDGAAVASGFTPEALAEAAAKVLANPAEWRRRALQRGACLAVQRSIAVTGPLWRRVLLDAVAFAQERNS